MPELLIFIRRPRPIPAKHLLRWLVPAAILAAIFWVALGGYNREAFHALNRASLALSETFWSCVTILGTGACAYALLAFTLVRNPRLMAAALITGGFAGLYTHLIKPLVKAARPAAVLLPNEIHVIGDVLTSNSFPSGHSVTAFALAATLIFFSRRPWLSALIALPFAGLVAVSRIAVGAHWPLDVLAGALGGWLLGMAGEALSQRWHHWEERGWRIFFGLAMSGLGVGLFFSSLGYPLAIPLQRILAVQALLGGLYSLLRINHHEQGLL